MRGYELQKARGDLRVELRRLHSLGGFQSRTFLALDEEDLFYRANVDDVSAHGRVVQRRLILDSLANVSGGIEAVARAWHTTTADLEELRRMRLLDASGIAEQIEQEVIKQHPETPEPGRYVAPQV